MTASTLRLAPMQSATTPYQSNDHILRAGQTLGNVADNGYYPHFAPHMMVTDLAVTNMLGTANVFAHCYMREIEQCVAATNSLIFISSRLNSLPVENCSDVKIRTHIRPSLRLLKIIRSFYSLDDNWDGKGSVRPPEQTIDNADYFLQNLEVDELEIPRIAIDGDGEISFSWQTDKIVLDVGMTGDKTYYYYGESLVDDAVYRENSRPIQCPMPRNIFELLKK